MLLKTVMIHCANRKMLHDAEANVALRHMLDDVKTVMIPYAKL